MLMRNHAERNRVHHIRLPKLGCGLDNLQWQVVHKISARNFPRLDCEYYSMLPPKLVAPISETKY